MLCKFSLREQPFSQDKGAKDSVASSLLVGVGNDQKIDLWETKTEVYEIIKQANGGTYRMRCLHINGGVADVHDVIEVAMTILVPHYEVGFFKERIFHIEFDGTKFMELSGADLMKLATTGELSKPLHALK